MTAQLPVRRLVLAVTGAGVTGPLQAVEDQVEPEFELVSVSVAWLQDVVDGQFGEVGVLAPGLEQVTGRYFTARKPRRSSKRSYDQATAARLWQVSADLAGVVY